MSLSMIQQVANKDMATDAWMTDNQLRGEMVARFRRYMDGDHDANMTTEMRQNLRISTNPDSSHPFASNQCDNVIASMTDRLTVTAIEGDNDAATQWSQEVLDWNRFDGLQMDVHDATLVDADSYMLVEYDRDEGMSRFCHELAWDGINGMLVIYASDDREELAAAIKVWNETRNASADTLRVNIYYPDRIEKFISLDGTRLSPFDDPQAPGVWPIPWTTTGAVGGEPLGVPVVPFTNKRRGKSGYGKSELADMIPLQDGLNRMLHSMVMTAENSAFPIRVAKGFEPPAGLTPGMWLKILRYETGADGRTRPVPLKKDDVADASSLEQGTITSYIDGANFMIEQIEKVTRTPSMEGANLSGEALKQNEVKLLGKVRRFQVKAGNAWEDVMALAARLENAFGNNSIQAKRWRTKWADAQMRNDSETIKNVSTLNWLDVETRLNEIAPAFGWDKTTIDQIKTRIQGDQQQRVNNALNNFNAFPVAPLPNGNGAALPVPVN